MRDATTAIDGLVQNRVTLSVKQLRLSMTVTCCIEGTYISLAPREGSHECYSVPGEPEPCPLDSSMTPESRESGETCPPALPPDLAYRPGLSAASAGDSGNIIAVSP